MLSSSSSIWSSIDSLFWLLWVGEDFFLRLILLGGVSLEVDLGS